MWINQVFVLLLVVSSISCRVVFPHVPDIINRNSLIPDECEWTTIKEKKKKKLNNDVIAVRVKTKVDGQLIC
jgi:hypothetical protein